MRTRAAHGEERAVAGRVTGSQLALEVAPFVVELSAGLADPAAAGRATELRTIERITPPSPFLVQLAKKRIDARERAPMRTKPDQLRMIAVTAGPAAEDGTGEERLAPGRNKTARVEIPRMQRPEPHRIRAPDACAAAVSRRSSG